VRNDDFTDAALILFGHGSTLNSGSGAPIVQNAVELRRRKIFGQVHEAYWKQEPHLEAVLAGVRAPRVFLAPMLISEGYFSEEVIPRALGFRDSDAPGFQRATQRGDQQLFYCKPVGTHDRMTGVLIARAQDVLRQFPFPRAPKPSEITLFLAGHGTERNENSRTAIERQVELIRANGIFAEVLCGFMEEAPRISDLYSRAASRNIVVVPFFISDGLHTQEDIPFLLGEPARIVKQRLANGQPPWRNPTEKQGKLVWYTFSVGSDMRMVDVILERVREAASSS
jgi:sirohydrochlorin cobaltochelatase